MLKYGSLLGVSTWSLIGIIEALTMDKGFMFYMDISVVIVLPILIYDLYTKIKLND